MILVDTGVWYAAYVEEEVDHAIAAALVDAPTSPLLTTDYIIDELLTLFVARGHRPLAEQVGNRLFTGQLCQVVWIERQDVHDAWRVFNAFRDKLWSFTDCVSYAVMKRLGINEAFALDDHFRQFGFVTVRP